MTNSVLTSHLASSAFVRVVTALERKLSPHLTQVRSGGPAMTVNSEGKSEVRCFWFATTELRSGSFSPASLLMLEPEKEKEAKTVSKVASGV